VDGHFEDIIHFLTIGTMPQGYSVQQKKEPVIRAADFIVIARHLYKMDNDEILHRYVLEFEQGKILAKAHGGGLQEDIMWNTPHHRIFFMQDYGGQL